jgi:hypothetical protein
MYAALRSYLYNWLFQLRGPQAGPVVLVQRRIFILPTRQGFVFAGVLVLMLIGSINYGLSLGFVLTFLLTATCGYLRGAPTRCSLGKMRGFRCAWIIPAARIDLPLVSRTASAREAMSTYQHNSRLS